MTVKNPSKHSLTLEKCRNC